MDNYKFIWAKLAGRRDPQPCSVGGFANDIMHEARLVSGYMVEHGFMLTGQAYLIKDRIALLAGHATDLSRTNNV